MLRSAMRYAWQKRDIASMHASLSHSPKPVLSQLPKRWLTTPSERSTMTVKRGEIYWVEFDPVKGSEQGGLRPALVVQNDTGNRKSPTTVVVAITRTLPAQPYPFVVVIEAEESGLPARSTVNCAQIATI